MTDETRTTDKPYTDADVELITTATEQHAIGPDRANADGHDPCSCGQWWGSPDGPSWDEHMAEVALDALAVAGRLAPTDDRHILQVDVTGWSLQHPMACRPDLLSCPVQLAAAPELAAARAKVRPVPPGRYEVFVSDLGDRLLIGDRVDLAVSSDG